MLFQKTIVNKYKQALPKEITNQPWEAFQQYFLNKDIQLDGKVIGVIELKDHKTSMA